MNLSFPGTANEWESAGFEMLSLFEMTPDLVCIAGEDGYFRRINPAVENKLGYTKEELFSRPIASFIHPDDRDYTARERSQLLRGKTLVNFQNRYIARNGAIIWLEWTSVFIPQKKIVFAIAKDITVTKRREKEIEDKYQSYKSMATHFKNRAEESRKYLAHELHEEVAQLAATVKMNIASIHHAVELSGAAKEKLEQALVLSDLLVKTVRRISFSVSPVMLEDLGLHATMEWECREFALLNGIPCTFTSNCDEVDLPAKMQVDLYRVCQEALNNIMEHAEAGSVQVRLHDTGDELELSVTDDGRGFDVAQFPGAPGLLNMRQLALAMNSNLYIQSEKARGTTVRVVMKHVNP